MTEHKSEATLRVNHGRNPGHSDYERVDERKIGL
jgi:hypothetical protein